MAHAVVVSDYEDRVEYADDDIVYVVHKTTPARMTVTFDFSDTRISRKVASWVDVKTMLDTLEKLK